ncbi:uncharacterized protein LOC114749570 [Neltuma alba]|uniref:uncharacterized protein LOC114731509 n=1 Tax=Neltuma alba TaxID=207710 RepID=UPI0010A3FAE6|nr:uncharacterized protein LOC114731509 [Prosopis alba]XP_028793911.1 uncharacterized protein LOC114749570 [Prosopis alba]
MKPWTCHPSTSSLSSSSFSLINLSTPKHSHTFFHPRHRFLRFNPIACSTPDSGGNTNVNDGGSGVPDSVQSPTMPPPGAVEVRFRRRSRRQARQQRGDGGVSNAAQSTKAKVSASYPKKWEDMSLAEKATDLYMGEKGLLFWLNKFAYASIFIMIGAWILFRFVGPSLNLYQLDSPPLSPSSVFKGSS